MTMPRRESDYRVDQLNKVKEQVRALAKKAKSLGILDAIRQTLETIIEQLRTRPLEWGDPERRTRKKGGYVYHGLLPPLFVRYVVFEPERAVCILQIRALPRSPLAGE